MSENIHPINAFPPKIQEIISHYSEIKGYPIEFFMTALLTAVSTALGRAAVLDTGNFRATSILWVAIVGKPGLTKSEAQDDAFKPILKIQYAEYSRHQEELDSCLTEKQKRKVKPAIKYVVEDITPEALSMTLANNQRGCGMVYDELAGFVKRFDRYAVGGDEQMFLTLFNGGSINRVRVDGKSNAHSKYSFLTIVGTIQPIILNEVFNQRSDSGFFDRWLICYPDNIKKQYPGPIGLDPVKTGFYEWMIENIYNHIHLQDFNSSIQVTYSATSYEIVHTYQKEIIDIENETDNDRERSILAKLEIYLHRFALLLNTIHWASKPEHDFNIISDEAATGAVVLTKYFLREAVKVRIKRSSDHLKDKWKLIYDAMPDPGISFDRTFFVNCCMANGIKARTADMWIKENSDKGDTKLFVKIKHGTYSKNI